MATFQYKVHLWHSSQNAEIFIPIEVKVETSDEAHAMSVGVEIAEMMANNMNLISFGVIKS